MKKDEMIKALELLVDEMQSALAVSEQMWQDKESHAKIVGYLQARMDLTQMAISSIIEK
jgi:hypothetical protein